MPEQRRAEVLRRDTAVMTHGERTMLDATPHGLQISTDVQTTRKQHEVARNWPNTCCGTTLDIVFMENPCVGPVFQILQRSLGTNQM